MDYIDKRIEKLKSYFSKEVIIEDQWNLIREIAQESAKFVDYIHIFADDDSVPYIQHITNNGLIVLYFENKDNVKIWQTNNQQIFSINDKSLIKETFINLIKEL